MMAESCSPPPLTPTDGHIVFPLVHVYSESQETASTCAAHQAKEDRTGGCSTNSRTSSSLTADCSASSTDRSSSYGNFAPLNPPNDRGHCHTNLTNSSSSQRGSGSLASSQSLPRCASGEVEAACCRANSNHLGLSTNNE